MVWSGFRGTGFWQARGPAFPALERPRRYRLGRGIFNLARGYAKYVLGLLIGSRGRFGNLPAISAF